jgi:hypothetical protein
MVKLWPDEQKRHIRLSLWVRQHTKLREQVNKLVLIFHIVRLVRPRLAGDTSLQEPQSSYSTLFGRQMSLLSTKNSYFFNLSD